MPSPIILRKGLYTDAKGKTAVYVVSNVTKGGWTEVEFDNVRTGREFTWPLEKFKERYPNRVANIEISFE